jgi:hypothetical protein
MTSGSETVFKIPKGYSDVVNQRATDNTMAEKDKRTNNDLPKTTHKTKD